MVRKAEEERIAKEKELAKQHAAATKVQTRSRMKAARAKKEQKNSEKKTEEKRLAEKKIFDASTTIASCVRSFLERQIFRFIKHLRYPFRHSLKDNEFVITTGLVAKVRDGFDKMLKIMKAKRQTLAVTSKNRLLWFDDSEREGYELVKDVQFKKPNTYIQLTKSAAQDHRFQICRRGKSVLTYTELSGNGARWIELFDFANAPRPAHQVKFMQAVLSFNLDKGIENMPIERDGFMRKLAMTSKHIFGGPRFFILQGGNIRFYAGTTSSEKRFEFPLINSKAEIEPCNHKIVPFGIKLALTTTSKSHILVAKAASILDRNEWLAEIAATMSISAHNPEIYRRRILRGRLSFEARPANATFKSPVVDSEGVRQMQALSASEDSKAEKSKYFIEEFNTSVIVDVSSLAMEVNRLFQ